MNTIWNLRTPHSYQDVVDFLGTKTTKKIAHNTYAVYLDGKIIVTYHGNKIIEYTAEGVKAGHCGWPTSTTKDRFDHLTPFTTQFTYNYGGERSGWGSAKERYDCKILVAGVALPDNGSMISFDWEGHRV